MATSCRGVSTSRSTMNTRRTCLSERPSRSTRPLSVEMDLHSPEEGKLTGQDMMSLSSVNGIIVSTSPTSPFPLGSRKVEYQTRPITIAAATSFAEAATSVAGARTPSSSASSFSRDLPGFGRSVALGFSVIVQVEEVRSVHRQRSERHLYRPREG